MLLDKATTGVEVMTAPHPEQDPWLTQALALQHRLGDTLALRDSMWVGTHNSFNTASNLPPSLSNTDSNQRLSLVDQLRIGIRSLEIDIHWLPSPRANGDNAVVVCHGRPESELNAGCSYEQLLAQELAPVRAWLLANPGEVVLLYLEDAFTSAEGFDAAAKAIDDTIGGMLYRPSAGQPCPLLPLDLRRADVLAAGKQALVMSGCGTGTGAWAATVFDDSVRAEEGNADFDAATCSSPSVQPSDYGSSLVRFYDDSTFVSTAVAGGDPGQRMTSSTIRAMVSCGANLFGLDQVEPSDPRLEAMVWSWADAEPSTNASGSCAVDGRDGRFHARACSSARMPFACVDATGAWFVSRRSGQPSDGARVCGRERAGAVFAVPGSGAHAAALRQAKATSGVTDVWLAYRVVGSTWSGNSR